MNAPAALRTPATGLAGALLAWWQSRTTASARHLRLVETLALGPKRAVTLFELDGQRFLAGMGADGVQTLLQVSSPAIPAAVCQDVPL